MDITVPLPDDLASWAAASGVDLADVLRREVARLQRAAKDKPRDGIRTIELADGTKRYRFTVDDGTDPETKKRRQVTRTFRRLGDATAERDRIRTSVRDGSYVRRWDGTVAELCDDYLRSATFGREASTTVSYRSALLPVRARLGTRLARSVERKDIEQLRDWMLAQGRRRGGKAGTGLSHRTVRLTLQQLAAAFEQACEDGRLARNPCRFVKPPAAAGRREVAWSADEVAAFLAVANADRLAAVWRLALMGLRRGEICGLQWSSVDLAARTITIGKARVLITGQGVTDKDPKSEKSKRKLPLDDDGTAALTALRKRQMSEAGEAGPAYKGPGEHVACDEFGEPLSPAWISEEFGRLAARAGVRRIRLHDARHSCLSLMEKAGVPISIISKWAGHSDPGFTYKVYVTANDEDLSAGSDALAKIYKIGNTA
jgi:integrase